MESGQLGVLKEQSNSKDSMMSSVAKNFGSIKNEEMRTCTREVLAKQKVYIPFSVK